MGKTSEKPNLHVGHFIEKNKVKYDGGRLADCMYST